MAKVRVAILSTIGKSVRFDPDATVGAQVGVNLLDADGNLLVLDALSAVAPESGGTIDHSQLTSIGSNTHAQIDTFIVAAIAQHIASAAHIADGAIHFTEASIDHGSIAGLGDDDHLQYLLLAGRAGQTVTDTVVVQSGGIVFELQDAGNNTVYEADSTNEIFTWGSSTLGDSVDEYYSAAALRFSIGWDESQASFVIANGLLDGSNDVVKIDFANGVFETLSGRKKKITRVTAAYTILITDEEVFANTDGSAYAVTLPVGAEGQHLRIVNTGTSANNLTVTPDGLENLRGANSSLTLLDTESLVLTYNAVDGWF